MNYTEQLQVEQANKQIFESIITNVPAEVFIDFYKTHNQAETLKEFGIRTNKQLVKILTYFNYDFSFKKALNKGKPAVRSHESYIAGGQKSAQTQKESWENKTNEEKQAWSDKQKAAHSTVQFKTKIREINKNYWNSLTYEQKIAINKKKSGSAKSIWEKLTEEEKQAIMSNRFKHGRCYNSKESKPNKAFADLLSEAKIPFERELCLETKKFDFKIDNILVEIDPWTTHNATIAPFECKRGPIDRTYHKLKTDIANRNGYRCIHVFDWDDQNKIISMLKKNAEHIAARQCEVREVSKPLAKAFLDLNHLQNYANDSIRLGLYFNNELVSIMTFGKPRYNKNYDYELIRYCSVINITGGAEKLFKAFLEKYKPSSVISYCDLSKFSGSTYEKLNFTLLKSPVPSKHWYRHSDKLHITDNLLRQHGFSRLVNHCSAKEDNLTTNNNEVLMISAGFVEIYDCGQATYVWENNSLE